MKRRILCLSALMLTGFLIWLTPRLHRSQERLPGSDAPSRQLVRIWVTSSVGGGESWLRECLRAWEKQHPGVMTFLRTVTPDEFTREDAVLPDLLLYTPGDLTAPQAYFSPITGTQGLREELLRAGRWQGQQYGLPLCYAAYALAVDSAVEPHLAATPAPTTLLGRPAASSGPDATATPGLPEGVRPAASAGAGLFTLGLLTEERPDLSQPSAADADVYRAFKARTQPAALLTTGQITALAGTFPFRVITPEEVVTDQVFLASVFKDEGAAAPQLLAYLTSAECQRRLSGQSLHTVREDLRLYAAGCEALIESAAARGLTCINAYLPPSEVHAAAWQYWQGRISLSQALAPLL